MWPASPPTRGPFGGGSGATSTYSSPRRSWAWTGGASYSRGPRGARAPPQRVLPQCYLYPTPHRRVLPQCYIRHPTYTYASPGGASFGSSPSTRRTSWSSHRLAGHSPSARATWGCSHARWIRRLWWRRAPPTLPRAPSTTLSTFARTWEVVLDHQPRPLPVARLSQPTNPQPRPSPPSPALPQARPHRGLPAEGAQRVQRHAHV